MVMSIFIEYEALVTSHQVLKAKCRNIIVNVGQMLQKPTKERHLHRALGTTHSQAMSILIYHRGPRPVNRSVYQM